MKTNRISNTSLLIARAFLGIVIAAHGAQKLLGWFGGSGFEGTIEFFTGTVGLPYVVGVLIILAESVGMLALIFGFAARIVCVSLIAIMLGAILTVHNEFFFMNWFGAQPGEGYEFHLLVIGLSSVIALNGGGAYSVDALIQSKITHRRPITNLLFS